MTTIKATNLVIGETYTRHTTCPALCEAEKLFTRPAPPPADHIGDATKLAGERAALITQHRARAESAKLRGPNYSPCISADELLELLDMLAADAQSSNQRYSDGYAAGLFDASKQVAQQVAVPMTEQELDDLLPTNDSMSRKDSQRWIARAVERRNGIGVKP